MQITIRIIFYNHTSDILNFKPCKLIFLNSHIFHILYIDTNKTIFVNIFSEVMSAKMIKMTIMAIIKWPIMVQSVANIIFWTEYEYEYIPHVLFSTNTNIFGIIFRTEYEYEYIRNTTVDRIRIFEYFWLEYSNIFGSNIWISFWTNLQIFHGTDRSQSLYSLNTKVTIMLLPLSKLYSVAKLSLAQSKFNPVGWAELALI